MNKQLISSIIKIFMLVILGTIISAYFVLLVGGRIYFNPFFSVRKTIIHNPGLKDGLVPQGLTYDSDNDFFYTCGYMTNPELASRIYQVDKKTKTEKYYELYSENKPFLGHTGGLQYHEGQFFLADEGTGLYVFTLPHNQQQKIIDIGKPLSVNNHSSFVFAKDTFLYVGEFNDDEKYACTNSITYEGITHKAIVTKYALSDLTTPLTIYSIPNQIQGFALLDDGTIVLSKSYGLSPSNYIVYNTDSQIPTNQHYDNAPVYFLAKPSKIIEGLPMSEDLDIKDGKVIAMVESACKKYFFGNLYFDTKIYSLSIK